MKVFKILIMLMMFLASACTKEEGKIKLEVMLPSGDYQDFFKSEVIPKFEKRYNEVEVILSDDRNLETRVASGDAPNLYAGTFGYIPAKYAKTESIIPLNQFEDFKELEEKIDERFLNKNFGENYYIPWNATTTVLLYNKELFKEAGLNPNKPPKTWKEYLEYAEKINNLPNRKDGSKVYGNVFWNEMLSQGGWYWSMLAPIYYSGNNGEEGILNKYGTDIAFLKENSNFDDFLKFMKSAQEFAPKTMEQNFFSRSIGMWLQFGYGWKGNLKNAKYSPMIIGEDVGIAPIPVKEEGMTSYSTLDGRALMIFRNKDKNKERIAWEMIKFLMEEDINQQANIKLGQLPTLKSLRENEYYKQSENKIFVEQLENTRLNESSVYSDYAQTTILQGYTEVVVLKRKDIDETLEDMSTKIREYIKSQQ